MPDTDYKYFKKERDLKNQIDDANSPITTVDFEINPLSDVEIVKDGKLVFDNIKGRLYYRANNRLNLLSQNTNIGYSTGTVSTSSVSPSSTVVDRIKRNTTPIAITPTGTKIDLPEEYSADTYGCIKIACWSETDEDEDVPVKFYDKHTTYFYAKSYGQNGLLEWMTVL